MSYPARSITEHKLAGNAFPSRACVKLSPDEVEVCERPDKPSGLTDYESKIWDDICAAREQLKVLKKIDGPVILACVEAFSDYVKIRKGLDVGLVIEGSRGTILNPAVAKVPIYDQRRRLWMRELNLTPGAQHSLLTLPVDERPDDPFETFE